MILTAYSHRVNRRRRYRIRRLLLFIFTITALFYFINSDFFSLKTVYYHGNEKIPVAELESLIGVEKGVNLWHIDTRTIEKRLSTHPLVAGSSVKRRWPDTINVTVQERVPVAILTDDSSFLLVDKHAVIMERLQRIGHLELPLISGISDLENLGLGHAISHPGLTAALETVQQIPAGELRKILEIKASHPGDLQLIREGNILVKFGDSRNAEAKIMRLNEALMGFTAGAEVEYIDVSYNGPPVVKLRLDGYGREERE